MQVRCELPVDAWGGGGPALRPGDRALVLAIAVRPDGEVLLRLLADPADGRSAFYAHRGLVTVAEEPSARWSVAGAGAGLALAPKAWLREGFWEDLAAGEPHARDDYERECGALLAEAHLRAAPRAPARETRNGLR